MFEEMFGETYCSLLGAGVKVDASPLLDAGWKLSSVWDLSALELPPSWDGPVVGNVAIANGLSSDPEDSDGTHFLPL
jgi:hypothetical protein